MNKFIMNCSPLSIKKPEEAFEQEYTAAKQVSETYLFYIDDIDNLYLPKAENQSLIYHGWMMPINIYRKFYDKCSEFGYKLINSPIQYESCHYFSNWYASIKDYTPTSLIATKSDIRSLYLQINNFMKENDCSVIIKDDVKSLKHNWNDACFINKNANPLYICKVIANFLHIKESNKNFQGNFIIRKYVDLKQIGVHPKSKMPLSKEYRSFIKNGKCINTYKYWDADYSNDYNQELINKIASIVYDKTGNNLFTIDTAQLEDGSHTCLEVGEGQVSSIPDKEDKLEYFKKLYM